MVFSNFYPQTWWSYRLAINVRVDHTTCSEPIFGGAQNFPMERLLTKVGCRICRYRLWQMLELRVVNAHLLVGLCLRGSAKERELGVDQSYFWTFERHLQPPFNFFFSWASFSDTCRFSTAIQLAFSGRFGAPMLSSPAPFLELASRILAAFQPQFN